MATSIDITPATVPISVTSGNSIEFTTTITIDDVVVDLTPVGNVATLTIEATTTGSNLLVISSDGVGPQITLNASGVVSISITAAQTTALAVGSHFYALKWTRPTGAVRTLHSGTFTVLNPNS